MSTQVRILLYGLEKSGKSTLITSFQKGHFTSGLPSTAQNTYEIRITKNLIFTIVEIGGRKEVSKFVSQLIDHVDAIIFVIDGSDERSFPMVKSEFAKILNHPRSVAKPLVVLFHKTDIAQVHPSIIIEQLDLLNRHDRPHQVFSSTAKQPHDFSQVLSWINERLTEGTFPIQDQVSRFFMIYILDMLNTKPQGLPLLSILGQLEIISRTGQIKFNRDKIMVILRKLLANGEVEYLKSSQVWKITEVGLTMMNSSKLITSGRYEKLRVLLDKSTSDSSLSDNISTTLDKEQKEFLDEYDIDELANLYKKTITQKRKN